MFDCGCTTEAWMSTITHMRNTQPEKHNISRQKGKVSFVKFQHRRWDAQLLVTSAKHAMYCWCSPGPSQTVRMTRLRTCWAIRSMSFPAAKQQLLHSCTTDVRLTNCSVIQRASSDMEDSDLSTKPKYPSGPGNRSGQRRPSSRRKSCRVVIRNSCPGSFLRPPECLWSDGSSSSTAAISLYGSVPFEGEAKVKFLWV